MTDYELILKVKENADSAALVELSDRYTGLMIDIARRYTGYSHKINLEDIKDDRLFNFYQWAKDYQPDRNTKFSTYVGERTKYLCLDLLTKTPDVVEINESNTDIVEDIVLRQISNEDEINEIIDKASKIDNPYILEIVRLRHMPPVKTWQEIGDKLNITKQRAHQIYTQYLPKIQQHLQYEFCSRRSTK